MAEKFISEGGKNNTKFLLSQVEFKQREAEVKEQSLNAEVKKQADADLYRRQKEAEAALFEQQKAAEAALLIKQKEAEGITAVGKTEAEAIKAKGIAGHCKSCSRTNQCH